MKELLHTTPEQVGISSEAINVFIEKAGKQFGIHSFMVLRQGKVAAECYWEPYQKGDTHVLFSMSKTFTAVAIGFAVQENLLSIDDLVYSFFSDKLEGEPCEYMMQMNVRHLLTMSTGHSVEPSMIGTALGGDWVKYFLTTYVDCKPGSIWCYNTPATYMLSAIISKVTGMSLFDYLTPRLFAPLGFEKHWWETCPMGINTGGFGLNVRLEDLAKFGQFLLNRGKYDDKQLLQSDWIDRMVHDKVDNEKPDAHPQSCNGYGYQIWHCTAEDAYRGDGAFGQYCIVLPKQDAVVVFNAGEDQMHDLSDLFFDLVVPTMGKETTVDEEANQQLLHLCESQTMVCPEGIQIGIQQQKYTKRHYVFAENGLNLSALSVDFEAQTIHFVMDGIPVTCPMGYREWVKSKTGLPEHAVPSAFGKVFSDVAVSYAWKANVCTVLMAYTKTPFVDRIKLIFDEKGVVVKYSRNVSFLKKDYELFGREAE